MFESEIHEALDKRNLSRVWELMVERTEWIQSGVFPQDQIVQITEDTINIRERLLEIQDSITQEITRSTRTHGAIRAYKGWEGAR